MMVYVWGLPDASGPDVALSMGAVMVAPPAALPPTADCTGSGTS